MKYILLVLLLTYIDVAAQTNPQGKLSPQETELWSPKPPVVAPANNVGAPPSDAIVLFDGKDLSKWVSSDGKSAAWNVKGGAMTVKPGSGSIRTLQKFGDVQLHIEWRAPETIKGEGQGRGNSGVFIQERYELQILDSYENETYVNGQAGALYKQSIPLVNACKKPGEWQSFDIIYSAPRFSENGRVAIPAYITVIHNGVLIQNHVPFLGGVAFIGLPSYEPHDKGSLLLQDHGDLVSFRNIWIREL